MLKLYCIVEINSLKTCLETQRKRTEELETESKTLNSGKKSLFAIYYINLKEHGLCHWYKQHTLILRQF